MLSFGVRAVALVAAALGFGCDPSLAAHSESITNATSDDGDPGVVALVQGGTLICTATLVAPRVLLTAAHCLPDGSLPEAYFGPAPDQAGTRIALLAIRRHPSFDRVTLRNDIALALLAERAPSVAKPVPLPPAPLDAGTTLRLVGFGRTDANDVSPPRKRSGTATIAALEATEIRFAPSPSQTCEGDSGGPALASFGGVEAIVGVTSSGDPLCAQEARDIRTDAYADAFIRPYLAATAEGAAPPGARCYYAGNCASGECAPARDEPRLSFCAPACGSGCPAGLTCTGGLCRHPEPSPGALGAACATAAECIDGLCSSGVCTRACFSDLPGFCPSGYACVSGGCFKQESNSSGGCSVTPHGDAGGLVILLVYALTRVRRNQGATRRARST